MGSSRTCSAWIALDSGLNTWAAAYLIQTSILSDMHYAQERVVPRPTAANLLITSVKRRSFLILLWSLLHRALGDRSSILFSIIMPQLRTSCSGQTKLDGGCQTPIPAFFNIIIMLKKELCLGHFCARISA